MNRGERSHDMIREPTTREVLISNVHRSHWSAVCAASSFSLVSALHPQVSLCNTTFAGSETPHNYVDVVDWDLGFRVHLPLQLEGSVVPGTFTLSWNCESVENWVSETRLELQNVAFQKIIVRKHRVFLSQILPVPKTMFFWTRQFPRDIPTEFAWSSVGVRTVKLHDLNVNIIS